MKNGFLKKIALLLCTTIAANQVCVGQNIVFANTNVLQDDNELADELLNELVAATKKQSDYYSGNSFIPEDLPNVLLNMLSKGQSSRRITLRVESKRNEILSNIGFFERLLANSVKKNEEVRTEFTEKNCLYDIEPDFGNVSDGVIPVRLRVTHILDQEEELEFDNMTTDIINQLNISNKSEYDKVKAIYDYITTNIRYDSEALIDLMNISNKSEYDKVKAIYDYITTNIRYDSEALIDLIRCRDKVYKDSILKSLCGYGALKNKKAICQGYTSLCYFLCKKAGIRSICMTGFYNTMPHTWNMVKIGDRYYVVDCTDGSCVRDKSCFFLRGLKNYLQSNKIALEPQFGDEFFQKYPLSEFDYDKDTWYNRLLFGSWF